MSKRPDDFRFMESVTGSMNGATALIVLGGESGSLWKTAIEQINPDVVIGANGIVTMINDLDYYVHTENIANLDRAAKEGDAQAEACMKWTGIDTPKHRLVHHLSVPFYRNKHNVIPINRNGFNWNKKPDSFSFRAYGLGLISGDLMKRPEIIKTLRVGTVGLQCLHLAGILGCERIYTIGFDLCLGKEHHCYKGVDYKANSYWGDNMFAEVNGLKTLWFWVDTAKYLKRIKPEMERQGLYWTDLSGGLFEVV